MRTIPRATTTIQSDEKRKKIFKIQKHRPAETLNNAVFFFLRTVSFFLFLETTTHTNTHVRAREREREEERMSGIDQEAELERLFIKDRRRGGESVRRDDKNGGIWNADEVMDRVGVASQGCVCLACDFEIEYDGSVVLCIGE
jgi:hypothetical protein